MKHPSDGGADVMGWVRPREQQKLALETPDCQPMATALCHGTFGCSVDRTAIPGRLQRPTGQWGMAGGKVAPLWTGLEICQ